MRAIAVDIQIFSDGYKRHGCNFMPDEVSDIAVVEYASSITNRGFLSANKHGGIFDTLDAAKQIVSAAYPKHQVLLGMPDLVCRVPKP